MTECGECGEEVAGDDVACRACGAHQWHRRAATPTRRTTAVREATLRRRGDGGDSRSGLGALRARWWSGAARAPGTARPAIQRPGGAVAQDDVPPPRTDTAMLRGSATRRAARSAEQKRSVATAVAVTVVAPLCLGLGVVVFGESLTHRTPATSGPVWVLVFESVPTSRVTPEEFARSYRGAEIDIVDGSEHTGLRPGYYSAITQQTYTSRRQAAADCGAYGRVEGAQCSPAQIG